MKMDVAGIVAEFIGTFALVFFGAGAIVLAQPTGPDVAAVGGLVTIALAHGLALAVFVTAAMPFSGGQLNPAVSIGLVVAGKQKIGRAGQFIVSQCLAAACAVGLLVFAFDGGPFDGMLDAAKHGATLGALSFSGTVVPLVLLEVVMTFALMTAIFRCVVDERAHKLGGLAVGMVVAMCIVGFGPVTGASMNPARSFGPALYGHWDIHWVYWVAPMVGACLAALVERFAFTVRSEG